ncbi:hypothetical protein CMUS01_16474 [Colletotrichum musicola]|uniref:Uncharacterized protein n=1 Tax=Colletotrichum musicola TaxID=2175873 RepID=A0A8H6MI19_9PEZI|nr:hypothetical protein CMUS01_16474 [Colletotrichum musicola]
MAIPKGSVLLENCYRPPDGTYTRAGDDVSQYWRNWGLAIYRTAYGPATDAQWRTLVDKINAQAVDEIEGYAEGEEDVATKLKSLFVLDARSDPALLADKTMDELREMHKRGREDLPEPIRNASNQRAFLLADADVLEGVDRDPYFWVKCVEVDYVERPPGRGRAAFAAAPWFGWMRMTTHSVVDLCADMPFRELASIGSPSRVLPDGQVHVYNGELNGMPLTDEMCSGK